MPNKVCEINSLVWKDSAFAQMRYASIAGTNCLQQGKFRAAL